MVPLRYTVSTHIQKGAFGHEQSFNRKTMLTCISNDFNIQSQKDYESFLDSVLLCTLSCSCGHSGCLKRHGYYKRSIMTEHDLVVICVLRVVCTECGKTHALMPSCIVPYQHILLSDQVDLLDEINDTGKSEKFKERFLFVEDTEPRRIYRRYLRFWLQRLISSRIHLKSLLSTLIETAFSEYQMQFLQIHRCTNLLFHPTT